jgi:hypothetical protein
MISLANSSQVLDRAAIALAGICAVHCLITPLLLVALPFLAATVWVDSQFHLWMLFFVVPTTALALWSGCRKHRDKAVVLVGLAGISLLSIVVGLEQINASAAVADQPAAPGSIEAGAVPEGHSAAGGCCALHPGDTQVAAGFPGGLAWLNVAGGLCLVLAHSRNFVLCRRSSCDCCAPPADEG